jgi:hypothetical protein
VPKLRRAGKPASELAGRLRPVNPLCRDDFAAKFIQRCQAKVTRRADNLSADLTCNRW